MALELQNAVVDLVLELTGASVGETPGWLLRPGRPECRDRWPLICNIYAAITDGASLPESMPPRERRSLDCVLVLDGMSRVLEVDEIQHFNKFRAIALRSYPDDVPVAFPVHTWVEASDSKMKLEGGGFGKPRPPLFPAEGGRHQQRAFRDALADIVPLEYGWLPTLRIADFEVKSWIQTDEAPARMRELLDSRLGA